MINMCAANVRDSLTFPITNYQKTGSNVRCATRNPLYANVLTVRGKSVIHVNWAVITRSALTARLRHPNSRLVRSSWQHTRKGRIMIYRLPTRNQKCETPRGWRRRQWELHLSHMRHHVEIYVKNACTKELKPTVREAHFIQDRIGVHVVIWKEVVESVELNTSFGKHVI